MVCKEDVVLWFKELSGHKRIDVMCTLLNKCLPTELRFFGTCLEDLGKQHFNQMKDFEVKANNPAELSELLVQCIISDARTRQKLALYICLIHSLNTTCSTNLYKTLSSLDINQIVPLSKNTDEKLLEELLLIYTIAVNHPAFTFEQRATLGNILLTLRKKEEEQLQASKLPEALNEEYVNSALNLASSDCAEVPPTTNPSCPDIQPRGIPSGLNYPTTLGSAGNYIPIPTYTPFSVQQHPPILWQVVNIPSLPAEQMAVPEMGPPMPGAVNFQSSPHISHQSSPSQSASPSRTTSPIRKTYHHKVERNNSQSRNKPNYMEYLPYQNSPVVNVNMPKKNCLERFEGKDINVKSGDELHMQMRGLIDRKTELGNDEIQLKTAVVNGIVDVEHREYPHYITNPKVIENEIVYQNTPNLPRPLEASLISNQPLSIVPLNPCCLSGTGPRFTPQVYCWHNLQALSLDNDGSRHCSSSSSNSDASSTSHSPPATPGNVSQNWEKGFTAANAEKPHRVLENSEGNAEDGGNISVPSTVTATVSATAIPKQERTRIFAGRGRGRLGNPVGIQTLPRGRGPHSNLVIDNSHKNINIIRKDGPRSAPPTSNEDKKGYVVPSAEAPQSSSTMALPLPSSRKPPNHEMVASGVPYSTTFLPTHLTGPPMFHTYHGAFVRPFFHFHNGDLQMYPYQPQPPFVPPPVVTYSNTILPPKIACYNCSSQSHHASECKEPTMEEYTSKGQYRIDYKPCNKQGECLSEK